MSEKIGNLSRDIENIFQKPNENSRTKNYNILNFKKFSVALVAKWKWKKNKSVNLKVYQQRLSNLRKRGKKIF